jgi:hypothetical protein
MFALRTKAQRSLRCQLAWALGGAGAFGIKDQLPESPAPLEVKHNNKDYKRHCIFSQASIMAGCFKR